jgi:tRNA threonylcarbamoyladenosine biosynthesis protein TsaE
MSHERQDWLAGRWRRWLLVAAVTLGIVLPTTRQAPAHPHVWIEAGVALVIGGGLIEAMQVSWTFDDYYSTLILEDFDQNSDGALSEAELALVAENQQAEDLASYNYFTHIKLGDRALKIETVKDFRASFDQGLLRFTFTVPIHPAIDPAATPLTFSLYDPEYYIDIAINWADPVQYAGELPNSCHPVVAEDEMNPIYFGMVYPYLVQLRCDDS